MSELQTIRLANGDPMPAVGLGFWKIDPAGCGRVVHEALASGYRHLDCAADYGNEDAIGPALAAALRDGACRREDLWVTSKLWNTYHAPEHVRPALERSLRDLQLDYLDLYLVHFPIALRFVDFATRYPPGWFHDPDADHPRMEFSRVPLHQTWAAMEQLRQEGLVRHIGVSNYNSGLLADMLAYASDPPSVLQVEMHPLLAQEKLLRLCRLNRIAVTAFSPLASASYVEIGMAEATDSLLGLPLIRGIAAACGRSPAQVLLRWALQRGTSVVPKSADPAHLRENIALFDFELDDRQMAAISALDRHRRFNDPGVFCEQAFNTLCPIYD